MSTKKQFIVALSGQPNCGKSTMFNAITGSTARVGNYPGITVERMEGIFHRDDCEIKIIDLPGTYSLTSYSLEEVVARNVIVDERPDAVICMLDATALERSLYLAVQLMEIGVPIVIALNMMDEVRKKGIHINSKKLSRLLQVPVVECTAKRGIGKERLMEKVVALTHREDNTWKPKVISYGNDLDEALEEMAGIITQNQFMTDHFSPRWLGIKYLEQDENVLEKGLAAGEPHSRLVDIVNRVSNHTEDTLGTYPEAVLSDHRYGYINSVVKQGVIKREASLAYDVSDKIDRLLTQRLLGPVIMLGVLYALFYLTFTVGAYPQSWMEAGFALLGQLCAKIIPEGLVQSLVVNGVIDGVGAVLSFTPLIFIMFAMLVFLEDLGYMARVAYMLDRVFRVFGLHGASVMPLIISGGIPGGCAVPGVMTARTLRSPRERLATIFTAPITVCGAKTTAFLVLAGAFFPGYATTVMFLLTIGSWFFVLAAARLLRWTVIKGESTPFVMELPPYRIPTLYGVFKHTWDRVWQFVKKAATVIFAISVLMWLMMTFPQLSQEQDRPFDEEAIVLKNKVATSQGNAELKDRMLERGLKRIENRRSLESLRNSVAGRIGIALESISKYAGFSWQMNIALFGGFAAKEVVVSTLSTAYSMGDVDPGEEAESSLNQQNMNATPDVIDFKTKLARDPTWTLPAIISVFVFMLLYAPCMVTVVAIAKESSWGWALFTVFGSLIPAYIISVIIFQVGTLLGG